MHPFLEITSSAIQQLDDEQARELVARLCKAELRRHSVGTSPVTWGGDQRAKDGGVDVRVDISSAITVSNYVPRNATAYQVKAESFPPRKIPGEMAPKAALRPAIKELLTCSGAYIIVSTKDNCSDIFLKKRRKAMSDCLTTHGLAGSIHLDFYDSRRIADWAGNYPGVLVWLRSILGKPIEGWKPYGPWAYHETSLDDEYLLDDKIEVFVPSTDEAISVTLAIKRLRGELAINGASARIVGLSGVGKTRLVQALFDNRIDGSAAALNQENVLYTDLSDNPTPQPTAMLEALLQEDADCVVVIDNCGQDIHRKLTEIVQRPESKIRLVTIEYDIRDDLPDGTACYRLEKASGEVITRLLKRRYQALTDIDIHKIVEFSDGNARVAFALASTSESKGELAQLRDDELFTRLFVQNHIENDELQRCAEAASLLYSFDVEDVSETSELAVLSAVAEVTIPTFYRNVSELQERGLVQERGKWKAILPHAIANRLALNAVESSHPSLLVKRFVADASERVVRSFSRRLGYLHESTHAQQIVGAWLEPDGLLGKVSSLSTLKREILENVASVNQRAALNALRRAVETNNFISLDNPNRAYSARLLRSLAYEPGLFDDAASALLQFALKEPDDYDSYSTRDILQSLFYSRLSGTLASPEQRSAFVRALAFSGDAQQSKVALHLLRSGLESQHFSSHYGFDFGALKRCYGWYPRTLKEIQDWHAPFVQIAVDLGKTATAFGAQARAILGEAFRGLWGNAQMSGELTDAARELAPVNGWPDGWLGIRNTLHFDRGHIDPASLDKLESLEKQLSPRDLRAKLQAKVLSSGSFGVDLDDDFEPDSSTDWHVKAHAEVTALGKAAAQDADDMLADLAPFVSIKNTTNKVRCFGIGVGQASRSVQQIIERLRPLVEHPPTDGFDLQFIHGLINGWNQIKPDEVSAFLDEAVEDEIWGALFPSLQLAIELDQAGYLRLIKSLEVGRASCRAYTNLGCGRRTDPLTVRQVSTLLSQLATKPDGGLPAAIDVLCMVRHCTDTKDEHYKTELQAYCLKFVGDLDWSLIDFANDNLLHHLVEIIKFALDSKGPQEAAVKTISRLIQQEHSGQRRIPRRLGKVLLPFFLKCPVETLDVVYTKSKHTDLLFMLTIRLDRHGDTAIGAVPDKLLVEWCKVSPGDRCVFAAQTCKLFERSNPRESGDEAVIGVSNIAINLLALAPEKRKVLETLVSRFQPNSWSGSLAAIMRHRLQYLKQLNPTGDEELMPLIEEMNERLSKIIESQEQSEQTMERSETSSFE